MSKFKYFKKNTKDQQDQSEEFFSTQVQVENQLKNNELNQISETFREFLENKRSVSQMMNQMQLKQALGATTTSTRKMKHFSNQSSPHGSPMFKSKQILVAKSNSQVKMKLEQLNRENNNNINNNNSINNINSSFTYAKENSFLASQTRSKTPNDAQNKFHKGQPNISLYNLIKNHQIKQNDMRFNKLKDNDLNNFGFGNMMVENIDNQQLFKKYMGELKNALKVEKQIRQKKEEDSGQFQGLGKELLSNQRDLYSVSSDIYNFYKEFDIRTERVLFFNKSILNDMMNQSLTEKNNILNIHQIESNLERLKKNFISIVQNGLLEINQKLTIAIADILRCYNLIIDRLCSDIMTIQEQQKENIHVKHVKNLEEEIIRLRVKLNEQKRSTEILQQDINLKQKYFSGKLKDQSILNQTLIQELNDSQTLLQNSLEEKSNTILANNQQNQEQKDQLTSQKPQFGFLNLDIQEKNNQEQVTQNKQQIKQFLTNEDDEVKTRKTSSSSFSQQQQDKSVLTTQFLMHIKPTRKPSFMRQDSITINGKLNFKILSSIQFWKGVHYQIKIFYC